jgi:hypothetical protein
MIHVGDCRDILRTLPAESVQCCVTSPPYYGLRDYGVDGQIGLEETPEQFIAQLVDVFREVRHVLRDDGTLWLNIGDSYANDGKWGGHTGGKHVAALHCSPIGRNKRYTGLKPKDLIGIPWMLAFALRADGWYLRQDIIWHKPNPMPESVKDRCTKAHEYLFLLTKSARYYFDADAIAEKSSGFDQGSRYSGRGQCEHGRKRGTPPRHSAYKNSDQSGLDSAGRGEMRNKRSVWTIATQPFKEAHFPARPGRALHPRRQQARRHHPRPVHGCRHNRIGSRAPW